MTCSIEKLVLITKFDPLFMQTILAEELRIAIFDDVRSRVMASMHTITHAQFTADGRKGDNSVVGPDHVLKVSMKPNPGRLVEIRSRGRGLD